MTTLSMGEVSLTDYIADGIYNGEDPSLERGSDVWMEANQSSTRLFEKSKISALRDERELIQKKTFTKWTNSHLQKIGAHINDLYHDLQDGRKLTLLLEILSGEKLPRPSKGRMRIHMLENVESSLLFLKKKDVPLTNVGCHDIVDGNPKITLGLIWTIILRFQIQDIMIDCETSEKRSAKESLLLWCQAKTQEYSNIQVANFTTSWRDGLAFCAIIHKHRPDLIEMDKLVKEDPLTNLNIAFDTAERELGVFRLLDAPDVNLDYPDEKSIMTYVATYYQYFSKMKQVEVSGSRIQKVIKHALDNEKLIQEYEVTSSTLMKWIQERIGKLKNRSLGNSLLSVQQQNIEFNLYRTQEKPPKFVEKCNLEIQMFEIASQLRLNHQKLYNPPEGLMVNEINKAWHDLEQEEHICEVEIRDELIRQQGLEELANKFDRKAKLREDWLRDNCKLLTADNFGADLPAVEASVKKHEAIETDIKAYEARINGVQLLSEQLRFENFHRVDWITCSADKVKELWMELLKLLDFRSSQLLKHLNLHKIFQEMIYIIDWMDELKVGLMSEDYGKHLVEVEDLLQKHALVEADITAQAERVNSTNESADSFLEGALEDQSDGYKPDVDTIKKNQCEVENNYKELVEMAEKRRKMLEESLKLHTFYQDLAEEGIWLSEKEYFVSSTEYGQDILNTTLMLQQHNSLEQDLTGKKGQTDELVKYGGVLLSDMPYASADIKRYTAQLTENWKMIYDLTAQRKRRLDEVLKLHQFYTECREVEADMDDLEAPIASLDYGNNEETVTELLNKHEILAELLCSIHLAIETVEDQRMKTLGEQDKEDTQVIKTKNGLDDHYEALLDKMNKRKQKLCDSLAVYKMCNDTELVETWVTERQSHLTAYLKVDKSFDLESCKIIQHRFEGFEQELDMNAERVKTVNQLADEIAARDPSSGDEINEKRNKLNADWETLTKEAEKKKAELTACLVVQTLYSEITETQAWILEKTGLLASVEDPGVDLSSVITLQRRLNTIERDIAAVPTKLQDLHAQAVDLSVQYPEDIEAIQTKYDDLQKCWNNLTQMVKQKNETLVETGELKRFIISLDDFVNWLQQVSDTCSSEDLPQNLAEAETMLDSHFEVRTVIDQHADEYTTLLEEGPKFVKEEQNDLQTQSLRDQMEEMQQGWIQLQSLWENRKAVLEQSMNHQLFLRDAKQCESILGQQELHLSKRGECPTADAVQEEIKKLEEFSNKCESQDDKINHVVQFSYQLCEKDHYAKEKIREKANLVMERRRTNVDTIENFMGKLREDLQLKQFLEDSDEVIDWMNERFLLASEESYEDLTNLRSKLMKHAAFEAELESNKTKIEALKKTGGEISEVNPENKPVVESRLQKIDDLWNILNKTSGEKKTHLTEANRVHEFNREIQNLDKWIDDINHALKETETGNDITTARTLHNKHKRIEKDVMTKKQRMIELITHPEALDEEKIVAETAIMEERFQALEEPLLERGAILDESLLFFQYKRDVDDAILWIEEKEPILNSDIIGTNLHDVQRSKKRHSNLRTEIEGHEPLITAVYERGDKMINEHHPRAEEVKDLKESMRLRWDSMKQLSQGHKEKLDESLKAKQYFFDAAEGESWMSEQELFLLGDDRAKDEENVQKIQKKHRALDNAIIDYEEAIKELRCVAKDLVNEQHPESEHIEVTQIRIEELYMRLKELCGEREDKLDEHLKLFQFSREVEDLESWISDRELVALSQDIGQDFDHVQMLEERFERYAEETKNIGSDRLQIVNAIADQLIGGGHGDGVNIGEYKTRVNGSWDDLLELLVTRKEILESAHEFHRFFHEGKETLVMITDKEKQLTEDLGRDQQGVYTLQRQHKAFESDLQPLGVQVGGLQEFAEKLKVSYAGEKLVEIANAEDEVVLAWKNLLKRVQHRTYQLTESDEYQSLLMLIQSMLMWISDMLSQIKADEQPKDISQCEHHMDIHQGRKIEMDAKEEKFTIVFQQAEALVTKNHYAQEQINERIANLRSRKGVLENEWNVHWEDLQLSLEVMQFARDAHLADDWMAQNKHAIGDKHSNEQNLESVLKLLEKHSNFERLLLKQEERFYALERLTTFELRNARQKQMEMARKEKEEKDRLEREFAEQHEREMEFKRAREQEEKKLKDVQGTEQLVQVFEEQHECLIEEQTMTENEDSLPSPLHDDSNEDQPTEDDRELAIGEDGVKMLGNLLRKPTKEAQNKKASGRVWKPYYVVLKNADMIFYRNEKEATLHLKPTQTISVVESQPSVASDYNKKKNVFRLSLSNGAEYLLQTDSPDDMSLWLQHIRACAVNEADNEEELKNRLSTLIPTTPTKQSSDEGTSPSPHASDKKKDSKKSKSSLFSKKKRGKSESKLES